MTKPTKKWSKKHLPKLIVIEKRGILKVIFEGKSYREIERMGLCGKTAARNIHQRFMKTRKIFRKKGSGRPRQTNNQIET